MQTISVCHFLTEPCFGIERSLQWQLTGSSSSIEPRRSHNSISLCNTRREVCSSIVWQEGEGQLSSHNKTQWFYTNAVQQLAAIPLVLLYEVPVHMCQCRSLLCVNSSQKHVLQLNIPSKDIQKGSPCIKSRPSLLSVACGVKSTAVECDKKEWDKTLWFHTKCSKAIRSYCIGPPRWSVRPQVSDNADTWFRIGYSLQRHLEGFLFHRI